MAFGRGGYDDFGPYMSVAKRLANGRGMLEELAKRRGRPVAPVLIEGRNIATSFWGKAWCEHLENYSDYKTRLPRGRTYVRNGSVLDLHISTGKIEAYVAGSDLYAVNITLKELDKAKWKRIISACAGRIGSLISLLRGELSNDVLTILTDPKSGLFPAPTEIALHCSCPDGAYMCKHIAAVLYGVGARLDQAPELFFVLRHVDQAELLGSANTADVLAAAGVRAGGSGKKRIAASSLSSLFGIELDEGSQVDEPVAERAMTAVEPVIANKRAAANTKKKPTASKARGRPRKSVTR
jgi:uncharacterized Zn finger protein